MSTKTLSATALALLIGVGTVSINTALAQNGGEARSNDREMKKTLDDKHLTPIRPIRRVGSDNWPAAKDPTPTNMPRETTGQAAKDTTSEDSAKQPANSQPQQNAQDKTSAQPDAKQQNAKQTTGPQTAPAQATAKQEPQKQEPPKTEAARQDTSKPNTGSAPNQQAQQNAQQDQKQDDKGFASIRLGTDAHGRVAINDAQERQISKALRKQHIKTFDVDVTIGAVAPASVQLGSVSAELVAVLPQFRGYSFFVTREEIVIVEPDNKKIVALVPVKFNAVASAPREERTTRRDTERTTRKETRSTKKEVTVGQGVPTEEEILAAPVVTTPSQTTVTRTYRTYRVEPEPSDTVIIERRRPRIFGLW